MDTTIQVSNELLARLKMMKIDNRESYEKVIWDLVEDRLEFSEQTKRNIELSEKEISKGKTVSIEQIKKKIGG